MAFLAALPIIGKIVAPILGKVFGIVDQLVEDKDLSAKLKAQIQMAVMSMDHKEFMSALEAQKSIILAEATGASWLQRNWRPLLMLMIMVILFNNYAIVPYLMLFGIPATVLTFPAKMWTLLIIGVGGYVGGRTVEKASSKIIETLKK
jgi:hypothetical protein